MQESTLGKCGNCGRAMDATADTCPVCGWGLGRIDARKMKEWSERGGKPVQTPPLPGWRRWLNALPWAITFAVAAWVLKLFPLASTGLILILLILWANQKNWRGLALFLLLCPVGGSFFVSMYRYTQGTGGLHFMGLPTLRGLSIDPDLRCYKYSGGCLVAGDEALYEMPNDAAMWLMTKLFGPQRGSYTGPYPTEDEAIAAAKNAVVVPLHEALSDKLMIGQVEVRLPDGVGRTMLRTFSWPAMLDEMGEEKWRELGDEVPRMRGVIWREKCLILRVPNGRDGTGNKDAILICIDAETGRPFAYYADGDPSTTSLPPVWAYK